jgi:hypothetical protein
VELRHTNQDVAIVGKAQWFGPTQGAHASNMGFRTWLTDGTEVTLRPTRRPLEEAEETAREAELSRGPHFFGTGHIEAFGDRCGVVVSETVSGLILPSEWKHLKLQEDGPVIREDLIYIAQNLGPWPHLVGLQSVHGNGLAHRRRSPRYWVRFLNSVQWKPDTLPTEEATSAVDAQLEDWEVDIASRSSR